MTPSLDAVALLRRLVDALPQLGPEGEAAAQAIARYLREAPDGLTLDRAFGVAPTKDGWPWWRREQRAREREAACQLLDLFDDAHTAHAGLLRFAASRGRFDGSDAEQSKPKAMRAYLKATGGRVPTTPKTLRRAADSSSMTICPENCDPITER